MADNWYPTIDMDMCVQCMQCVEFCPHGVLEEREGAPLVVDPASCVEFCRGCQKACDAGAIFFPGDR